MKKKYSSPYSVIPAKAGIHTQNTVETKWIPAFAGMTVLKQWCDRECSVILIGEIATSHLLLAMTGSYVLQGLKCYAASSHYEEGGIAE